VAESGSGLGSGSG